MSFCFDTKEELCRLDEKNKTAMLYGMILFADIVQNHKIQIVSENVFVINTLESLASELFGVHFLVEETASAYTASLTGNALKIICKEFHMDPGSVQLHFNPEILSNQTDVYAFLKGAFLTGGSISNPQAGYHLELVTHFYQLSKEILAFLEQNGFPFKSVVRKSHYVLYLKDSTAIEQFLYILGAQQSAFELVNVKIYKQLQNDNNRLNNCEGYNRDKTMNKSIEQIHAIHKIQAEMGIDSLSEDLRAVCKLRLEYPYASLSELVERSKGNYSKAGLSRRLTKIISIATQINGE